MYPWEHILGSNKDFIKQVTKVPTDTTSSETTSYFSKVWKPVLLLGRGLGIVSTHDFGNDPEKWGPSRWSKVYSALITASVIFTQTTLFIDRVASILNYPEAGGSFAETVYRLAVPAGSGYIILMYVTCQFRRRRLLKVFRQCHDLMRDLKSPSTLWTTTALITSILVFGLLENVMFDVVRHMIFQRGEGNFFLNKFATFSFILGVQPTYGQDLFGAFRWIMIKISAYTWTYMDALIILVSKGLAYQYHLIGEDVKANFKEGEPFMKNTLKEVYKKFLKVQKTVRDFSHFFSPILVTLYCANILQCSSQINRALIGSDVISGYSMSYTAFMIIQILARIVLVTLSCGEIHQQAANLEVTLNNVEERSEIISRMREHLNSTNPVGVNVYGMFVIKRATLLSITNFLFSFQIVLLQTAPVVKAG